MGDGAGTSDKKARRLAEALRANLKRRKEQSRARSRPTLRDTSDENTRGRNTPQGHDSTTGPRLTCRDPEGL